MLAWIDLETTGLFPHKDVVLEVACIITDDDLEVLGTFNEVIHHPIALEFAKYTEEDLLTPDNYNALQRETGVQRKVIEMHIKNGLWRASAMANPREANYVDTALGDFIRFYTRGDAPQLAGSTISFDRSFLEVHFPDTTSAIHYRNLDVTTLNEMVRRNWRGVHDERPRGESNHRALDDIKASIETYRYYVDVFNTWSKVNFVAAGVVS
jgi:oligoribonuclease